MPLVDFLHCQITQETDEQEARHDVHGHRVGLGRRNAGIDLHLTDVIHQHRSEDAGC